MKIKKYQQFSALMGLILWFGVAIWNVPRMPRIIALFCILLCVINIEVGNWLKR